MRRIYKICLFAFMALAMPMLHAQTEILVENFSLFEDEAEINLTWILKAGSICNGVEIQRSLDGTNFERVGRIPGVCGDVTSPVRYDYIDETPVLNRINFYRLLTDDLIISPVISIEVVELGKGGSLVRPNPVVDESRLYFDNARNEVHHLALFDQRGNLVREQESFLEYFLIDGKTLGPGLYFFQIRKKEELVTVRGRLLIQH